MSRKWLNGVLSLWLLTVYLLFLFCHISFNVSIQQCFSFNQGKLYSILFNLCVYEIYIYTYLDKLISYEMNWKGVGGGKGLQLANVFVCNWFMKMVKVTRQKLGCGCKVADFFFISLDIIFRFSINKCHGVLLQMCATAWRQPLCAWDRPTIVLANADWVD